MMLLLCMSAILSKALKKC